MPSQKKRAPGFLHSRLISIISISMVLFLIGIVTMVGLVGRGLQDYARESLKFTLILPTDISESEMRALREQIERQPFVREVTFHSKEEAREALRKDLGEDPIDLIGMNPLSPAFEVGVRSNYVARTDSITRVAESLSALPGVDQVQYRRDLLETLNRNIRMISIVMIAVAALLLLISFVLINNTIRLLIYSKRFLIHTMRLVGAKPSFIRRPFIRSNVVSGLVAALLALGFLVWLWIYLVDTYPLVRPLFTPLNGAVVAGVVILLGVLIAWWSALLAVNKYMRMDVNKLYRA